MYLCSVIKKKSRFKNERVMNYTYILRGNKANESGVWNRTSARGTNDGEENGPCNSRLRVGTRNV